MKIVRIMASLSLAAGLFAGSPASAQFFLKSYDLSGGTVTGAEPEMSMSLPGATPAEIRAGLVWNLRDTKVSWVPKLDSIVNALEGDTSRHCNAISRRCC